MKYTALLVVQIFLNVFCSAQTKKPEFEFTLYGEDAKGHKDSVAFGFDHNARKDLILDTTYSDKDISNIKYDTVFEMRAHKITYLQSLFGTDTYYRNGVSKHVTIFYSNRRDNNGNSFASCIPYGLSNPGFILMRVKYPPLKLRWNKKYFSNKDVDSCLGSSFLISNEGLIQEYPPSARPETVYLGKDSFLIDTLRRYVGVPMSNIDIKYSNGSVDSLEFNYLFQFVNSGVSVSVTDVAIPISNIYPNPCKDQLHFFIPNFNGNNSEVKVYDINGRFLKMSYTSFGGLISIDVTGLNTGEYVSEIISQDGKHYVGRFEKVE